jgi:hypothetical protein
MDQNSFWTWKQQENLWTLKFSHRSTTHVILHVFYHLITIPCHLHQEIKENVQDSPGIAHLLNRMHVLQPKPIYRTIRLIFDLIRPIFSAPLMNWSFASTFASGARAEWGECRGLCATDRERRNMIFVRGGPCGPISHIWFNLNFN